MTTQSYLPRRFFRLTMTVLAVACLAVWSVTLLSVPAEAGTIEIPAWAFTRGNARIHADPAKFADAGPVVGSGPEEPWGWRVEYDVDIPVDGNYILKICYATAESRPVQVFFDSRNMAKCCNGISLSSASSENPNSPTFNSSDARWEILRNRFGGPDPLAAVRNGTAKAGKHKLVLTRRGPLPHLVALRLETPEPFPEDWQPPKYKVANLDSIPAEYRNAFTRPSNVDVAALRVPVKNSAQPGPAGLPGIPAWTFDRGNARIYASPDQYADAGPVVGSEPGHSGEGVVEYDIDFPADGEYTLHVSYASAEARPLEVSLDGKSMGMCCVGVAYGSAPFEEPVVFTSNSSGAPKGWEGMCEQGKLVKMAATKGKHTLKFSRKGPLPNLLGFTLGWKPASRKMPHFDKVPITQRSVFLPADAVNIGALRLAIEDTIETFGPQYPNGPQYLKRLDAFDKQKRTITASPGGRTWASEKGKPETERTIEGQLAALRREAMLAHPALKFDKLLFVKRPAVAFNTYQDNKANEPGGNLCVLSPVSANGKVTTLVPELDGGRFTRFDLSYDAKKIVFGYKKKGGPFRIHEIEIDPVAGKMVPGSLRQLTFTRSDETECVQRYGDSNGNLGFDDMDPCYLPNGDIMFSSTRPMRRVFCNPSVVASLHLMDGYGKNLRCLSAGPLNEVDPAVLDDGRVIYTRWEYVDKGLGNGQSLWAVRPDGSGSEHIYKNTIVRPAQLLHARNIPGSRRLVTVGAPHCGGRLGGTVILVDYRTTRRSEEAMTCITPEIAYPCMSQATWNMGFFQEPYPFSEKFFVCSHKSGAKPTEGKKSQYGLYVLDGWGNRAELYLDPEISCYQPVPLQPRRRPVDVASFTGAKEGVATADKKVAAASTVEKKPASLFIQNLYQGMTGIERGRVKYIRVMGVLPWPWSENGIFRLGLAGNVHRKKVYGIAEVHEDGSACFEVPAGENILFQALDENYMMLQHMPTFINMNPGEKRGCIGCHEHRRKAPGMVHGRSMAMVNPIQTLVPQPGDTGPRMVHYAADVQPVLDKHCVGCHSGSNPKTRLDLTSEPTDTWNRSYESILGRGLVASRNCGFGRSGFRPSPPLSFGSHLSKLAEQIKNGDPCKEGVSREEFIRIVTWIDANTPYYGTYRGKRDLKDRDHPDFRPLPLVRK